MDKIKEILTNHIYFKEHYKENQKDIYVFKRLDTTYEIIIFDGFDPDENNPISYDTNKEVCIQKLPYWYKKLFEEVYNLYYEKHRIRYLMSFGRKPFDDIVWIHSFYVEDGDIFYKKIISEEKSNIISVDKKWKMSIIILMGKLTKEGYELGELKENEYLVWCTIR